MHVVAGLQVRFSEQALGEPIQKKLFPKKFGNTKNT